MNASWLKKQDKLQKRMTWLIALAIAVLLADMRVIAEVIAVIVVLAYLGEDYLDLREKKHSREVDEAFVDGFRNGASHEQERVAIQTHLEQLRGIHNEDEAEERRRMC